MFTTCCRHYLTPCTGCLLTLKLLVAYAESLQQEVREGRLAKQQVSKQKLQLDRQQDVMSLQQSQIQTLKTELQRLISAAKETNKECLAQKLAVRNQHEAKLSKAQHETLKKTNKSNRDASHRDRQHALQQSKADVQRAEASSIAEECSDMLTAQMAAADRHLEEMGTCQKHMQNAMQEQHSAMLQMSRQLLAMGHYREAIFNLVVSGFYEAFDCRGELNSCIMPETPHVPNMHVHGDQLNGQIHSQAVVGNCRDAPATAARFMLMQDGQLVSECCICTMICKHANSQRVLPDVKPFNTRVSQPVWIFTNTFMRAFCSMSFPTPSGSCLQSKMCHEGL